MFSKLFFIRSQEIDFRQESAKYRNRMNFDHHKSVYGTAENVICE
jgi:hypothetical protein